MIDAEARLREEYTVREERFEHGALRLDVLLPRSPEALIDEAEFEADERLPYWAELWPSARGLARWLLDHPPAGRVVELGCGLGLPSLVLHARGADVLATDYYGDALRFAGINAERNALPPLPTRLVDWRRIPPELGRFDVVLLADVMYEERNADAVADALPAVVGEGGYALLADPGRSYLGAFRDRMEERGWSVRTRDERDEPSDRATGAISRVQILEVAPS